MSQSLQAFSTVSSCFFINPFTYINHSLKEVFKAITLGVASLADQDHQLAFQLYSMFSSCGLPQEAEKLDFLVQKNPIKIEGRRVLVDGLLQSTNCMDRLKDFSFPLIVIQSKTNSIASSELGDLVLNLKNEEATPPIHKKPKWKSKITISGVSLKKNERVLLHIEGNHDLISVDFPFCFKESLLRFSIVLAFSQFL